MSEELIEELARALCKHDNRDPDYEWEEYSRCLDADGRPETYTLVAWREYEPQAWAILPIIRRLQLEAGEKVKEAIFAQTDPRCGKCDYAYAALDVAAIIGDSND